VVQCGVGGAGENGERLSRRGRVFIYEREIGGHGNHGAFKGEYNGILVQGCARSAL
jgi:hypothetical protein